MRYRNPIVILALACSFLGSPILYAATPGLAQHIDKISFSKDVSGFKLFGDILFGWKMTPLLGEPTYVCKAAWWPTQIIDGAGGVYSVDDVRMTELAVKIRFFDGYHRASDNDFYNGEASWIVCDTGVPGRALPADLRPTASTIPINHFSTQGDSLRRYLSLNVPTSPSWDKFLKKKNDSYYSAEQSREIFSSILSTATNWSNYRGGNIFYEIDSIKFDVSKASLQKLEGERERAITSNEALSTARRDAATAARTAQQARVSETATSDDIFSDSGGSSASAEELWDDFTSSDNQRLKEASYQELQQQEIGDLLQSITRTRIQVERTGQELNTRQSEMQQKLASFQNSCQSSIAGKVRQCLLDSCGRPPVAELTLTRTIHCYGSDPKCREEKARAEREAERARREREMKRQRAEDRWNSCNSRVEPSCKAKYAASQQCERQVHSLLQ